MKAIIKATPFVGRGLDALADAQAKSRDERMGEWYRLLESAEDPEAFNARICSALEGEDGDDMRAAILESARAAHEAVDAGVLPSIARLTRRYLNTGTPSLRVYREMLSVLRVMEGDVHAALTEAMPAVVRLTDDVRAGRVVVFQPVGGGLTTYVRGDGAVGYRWCADLQRGTGGIIDSHEVVFYEGELAPRIVLALNGTTPLFRAGSRPPQGAEFDPVSIEVLASVLLG